MVQNPEVESPPSGFQSCPPIVASRLVKPHSTEDKTHWSVLKQLSTSRNTQRDSELYKEDNRDEIDRGDPEKKRKSQKGKRTIKLSSVQCSH